MAAREVWLAAGLVKRYRVTSWAGDLGEFRDRAAAELLIELLIYGGGFRPLDPPAERKLGRLFVGTVGELRAGVHSRPLSRGLRLVEGGGDDAAA